MQVRFRSVARIAAHKASSNTACHCLPSADGRKGPAYGYSCARLASDSMPKPSAHSEENKLSALVCEKDWQRNR